MSHKITIVDYGLGNILSVSRAIADIGLDPILVTEPDKIRSADYLLLPGVGSFQCGMSELNSRNFLEPIKEYVQLGKPLLGICLGMHLLFDSSEESDNETGLAFIPGRVTRIVPKNSTIKVPHIGWSRLKANQEPSDKHAQKILKQVDGKFVYFVHSYHPKIESNYLLASSDYYNCSINAIVKKDNLIGCQFHPEKSGKLSGQLLESFLTL